MNKKCWMALDGASYCYSMSQGTVCSLDLNEQSILTERRPGLNECELQQELTYDKATLLTF